MSNPLKNLFVRDRLQLYGEERLSDAECLSLILRPPDCDPVRQATELLDATGGLDALARCGVQELATRFGLDPAAGESWVSAVGLARRLAESRFRPGAKICSAQDVAQMVRAAARGSRTEGFFVVLLDTRHHLTGIRRISSGGISSAPADPRDVFGLALRAGAAAVIVAHNHPSGDPQPSAEDGAVTTRLREVGRICGVILLDHVVVGADRYYSFADSRLHRFD